MKDNLNWELVTKYWNITIVFEVWKYYTLLLENNCLFLKQMPNDKFYEVQRQWKFKQIYENSFKAYQKVLIMMTHSRKVNDYINGFSLRGWKLKVQLHFGW